MSSKESGTVKVITGDKTGSAPNWDPAPGKEFEGVIERTFKDTRSTEALVVKEEAIATLGRCLSPDDREKQETGLVIGYVQSGKTLSFTAVAALARDNGYQLIILLGGTILNLLDQSENRLERDLNVRGRSDWKLFTNEDLKSSASCQRIQKDLEAWTDSRGFGGRSTVVITVLKNGKGLDRLSDLMEKFAGAGVLEETSVLIIDDEADQAGLNNKVRRGGESPTYSRILRLRDSFPQHTYLQYTATAQAILLMSLFDSLSPSFAQLLTPGPAYMGGKQFHKPGSELIRVIPESELEQIKDESASPPDSLVEAFQTFVVISAISAVESEREGENSSGHIEQRSMLVHPHMKTRFHEMAHEQITALRDKWMKYLKRPEHNRFRAELVDAFKRRYDDLKRTSTSDQFPSWEELVDRALPWALSEISVHEINRRRGNASAGQIKWEHERFTVLVGAQKLERGYTVEGLAVTYMPRGRGGGNVDTIQQRARWFGYKEDFFGLCRVYLAEDLKDVYERYIVHEEQMRASLESAAEQGSSIREWRREFLLDRRLRPTRSSVIGRRTVQGHGSGWFSMKKLPRQEANENNRRVRKSLLDEVLSGQSTEEHDHKVRTKVPLAELMERLVEWEVTSSLDSIQLAGIRFQLLAYRDRDVAATADVWVMRPGAKEGGQVRTYRPNHPGAIEVFQGRDPVRRYPGDRNVIDKNHVAIQLYSVHVKDYAGETVEKDVPYLAVYIPDEVSEDWIAESPVEEEYM